MEITSPSGIRVRIGRALGGPGADVALVLVGGDDALAELQVVVLLLGGRVAGVAAALGVVAVVAHGSSPPLGLVDGRCCRCLPGCACKAEPAIAPVGWLVLAPGPLRPLWSCQCAAVPSGRAVVPQGCALPNAPRERHITRLSAASRKGEIHADCLRNVSMLLFIAAKNLRFEFRPACARRFGA